MPWFNLLGEETEVCRRSEALSGDDAYSTVQQEFLTIKLFSGGTLIIFIRPCPLLFVLSITISEMNESHYTEWWVCVCLVYTGVQLQRIDLLSANVFWRQTNLQLNEQLARTNLDKIELDPVLMLLMLSILPTLSFVSATEVMMLTWLKNESHSVTSSGPGYEMHDVITSHFMTWLIAIIVRYYGKCSALI